MAMKAPAQNNKALFAPREEFNVGLELLFASAGGSQSVRLNGQVSRNGEVYWSSNNAFSVSVITMSSAGVFTWKDGVQVGGTGAWPGNLNFNGIYALGTYAASLGNFAADMTMGEFIIINKVVTTEERAALESYLSTRWAA